MPITPADVTGWLEQPAATGPALVQLQHVCDAVEAHYLDAYRPDPPAPAPRPANRRLGLVMMAARLWRRQGTPEGIGGGPEIGPVYVARFDPDIDRLLSRQTGVA